jgi:hypothetical protein
MKSEGGRMKAALNSVHFIPHPSSFILSLTPSLTVGLLPMR